MSDLVKSLRSKLRVAKQEIDKAGTHVMRQTPLDTALDQLRDTLRDANEILDELHPVERRREDRPDALRLDELGVPASEVPLVPCRGFGVGTCGVGLQFDNLHAMEAHLPGPIEPSNPIKWLVHKALMNSQGQPVQVIVQLRPPTLSEMIAKLDDKKYFDPQHGQ